jgi:serine/threonine protein kinase
MPAGDTPLPSGFKIDHYIIRSVLGRGGFGYTYLAEDPNRATLVAIKEHFPQQLAKRLPDGTLTPLDEKRYELFEQTLQNFRQEIRLLLRFPHPNLPYIHRVFDGLGTGYFSMDLEQGETLEKWSRSIARSRLESELLLITHQISDALALLHRNGIFHRDIKPDNIIVRRDGTPVLLDFGIATDSMVAAQALPGQAKFVSVGYSPIEQYGYGEAGAWSDIYSLSATLYKIVAGRRVVAADVRAKSYWKGGRDLLPKLISQLPSGISPRLAEAIDHGLEIDLAKRPQNMMAWLALLPLRPVSVPVAPAKNWRAGFLPRWSIAQMFQWRNKRLSINRPRLSGNQIFWLVIGGLVTIFLVILVMAILTL